jgi:hypothetical protein
LDPESKGLSLYSAGVHRIDWIFENPAFVIDGFSSTGGNQGQLGDCWFIAALSAVCAHPSLMEKICVARNETCSVYGFVFFRDGEWTLTVVDDNLYLENKDYQGTYDPTGVEEKKHKKQNQTGSDALYFGACTNENETWLPLIEKAFAKIHGDFKAIVGGPRYCSFIEAPAETYADTRIVVRALKTLQEE